MQNVCVLKSGGDYGAEHVKKLFRCCRKHVMGDLNFYCLTDFYSSRFLNTLFYRSEFYYR